MKTNITPLFFIAAFSLTMTACSTYPTNKANGTGSYTGSNTNSAGYSSTANGTQTASQTSNNSVVYPKDNTSSVTYSNNESTQTANSAITYSGNNKPVEQNAALYSNNNNRQETANNNATYSVGEPTQTAANKVTYASSENTQMAHNSGTSHITYNTNQPSQKGFVIQLIASIDSQKAGSIKDTFSAEGYRVIQNTINSNGRLLHRVQIGPYSTQREARAVFDKMKRRYKRNTYVNAAFINRNK